MILKSYEINKIDLNKNKIILLYGKNDGFKNEATKLIIKKKIIASIILMKRIF